MCQFKLAIILRSVHLCSLLLYHTFLTGFFPTLHKTQVSIGWAVLKFNTLYIEVIQHTDSASNFLRLIQQSPVICYVLIIHSIKYFNFLKFVQLPYPSSAILFTYLIINFCNVTSFNVETQRMCKIQHIQPPKQQDVSE